MQKKMAIGAGALAVVLVAGTAYAAMGHGGPRMRMMKHMISARIEDAEDYVEATPQQRVVIEQSKDAIFEAIKNRHRPDHARLVELLTADTLDTKALYALADQHAQDIQDLAKVIVPEIQKIHDVLTPEQRKKLAAKAKEMREHHGHHGFGGPPEE